MGFYSASANSFWETKKEWENMRIIKPSKNHLTELASLFQRYMGYHEEIDGYFTIGKEVSELWIEYMKGVLEDENQIVFSALANSKIVGYMTAKIVNRPPVYEMKRVGLVGDAYVLPENRREGVFNQLLERVFDWMRAKGVTYVEHGVAAKNKLGLEVWRRSGFEDFMVFMRKKI